MRYSDALNAARAPRINWPELPQIRMMTSDLRAALPAAPVTIEHTFRDEILTLRGPLLEATAPYTSLTILKIDGSTLRLWSQQDLLRLMLAREGHIEDPSRYPSDAHALILDYLARPLLDALGGALRAEHVEVLDHCPAGELEPERDCIAISVSGVDFDETHLALSAPEPLLKTVAGLFLSRADDAPTMKVSANGVEFACSLLAPEIEITGDELSSLQQDDVLMLDAQWLEADTYRFVVADTLLARVSRDGDIFCVQSDFEPLRSIDPMTRTNEALSELPVTVSIELARKSLSLEALEAVTVGEVLDFADADLDILTLTANGTEVGKGVLVRSGDHIGIRMTSLS